MQVLVRAFLAVYVFFKRPRGTPLPPGPRKLPIIGNAHQLPKERQWIEFEKWGKQYGDVVYISVFNTSMVILNSAKATIDLLEARSAIYSDRATMPMAGELVGYGESVAMRTYDSTHRRSRKLMFETLAPRKAAELHPVHEEKIHEFIGLLGSSPENYLTHIRMTVAAIVLKISHGHNVSGMDDPLVKLAERANAEFSLAVIPGAFLVDMLPILRYLPEWFPGATFQKTAKQWRKTMEEIREVPYENIKKQVATGTASPSFTSDLVEKNLNPTPEEENVYKWTSTAFYSAGADTTVSAVTSFFLAMTLYPEVQEKAQAELDSVIGSKRLPTFSDRPNLPYIEGMIREVYRWNPVAPMALPHRLIKDDVYEGMFIPAGSIVMPNTWAVLHDPDVYPSPSEFNPDRYLAPRDEANKNLNLDPRAFAFGYGRRVCPGQSLADSTLFLTAVMTLSIFNISKSVDVDGSVIEPSTIYSSGALSHPPPFKCQIVPRSESALARLSV